MRLDRHKLRSDLEAGKALTSVAILRNCVDDCDGGRTGLMGVQEADSKKSEEVEDGNRDG